jgi:hypothetical protein
MGRAIAVCCALALTCSQAWASCQDNLQDIRPRVDNLKFSNKPRYLIADRWWVLAQEAAPLDEVQCLNFYARVVKALNEPIPQVNNCLGPNAYLPQCEGAGAGQAFVQGTQFGGGGVIGAAIGGVGGGGGAAAAGPLGTTATQPFTPPGSVGTAASTPTPP